MQRRTFLASAAATGVVPGLNPALALAADTNPMLAKWTGPYGGVPAFDKVKVAEEIRKLDLKDGQAAAAFPGGVKFVQRHLQQSLGDVRGSGHQLFEGLLAEAAHHKVGCRGHVEGGGRTARAGPQPGAGS